ncbi:3-oxoacyl-ACP synthase [Streptomyces rimosus subsp. rimosus]|uniref:3-oxoacyl-ACP synthase n=2 Tax=Streptomyces rimosus subsp. rimosus TaxID=132474 RepID=A0A8A1UTW0_STRR1|nr:3-oxoacyl-ACP synthase [Streptomyces rimosus]KOG68731.1 3-oxoacyl-ACP synthase [Kitasatospora aureofaciens]KOT41115.1 3-oxoacyl-ACP synthase [Streptomyces sp. NRRL WC-3701]KOT45935.1 3-oxoacyl-ACP synthase [Streptomyces rimosus subsp. rimosus]KOT79663.1 3-oxoacyl-ACP synthase [Streptomyces rimosus subsp. pseudoverticillatus]MYT47450.1 3-oxoacyl-ACP synthase [Streptomyces sp. SID5471]QGY65262.1 3-oxoacyl-ACP synthase [Streptomyces rimosus R6-500]QST82192.1 3-oxoacyl-ACP synthase [Streptomy
MTSFAAVSTYLPPSVPISELREESPLDAGMARRFQRFYGLASVCRDPERTEAELLLAAAAKLDGLRGQEERVRYLVQARTFVSSRPDPTSALRYIGRELGLSNATAFSVAGQACASGLQAVDICGRLLAADADPDALALVLTGEKTFTPVARCVPRSNVGGEAAAAVLVRRGGAADGDRVLGRAVRTHGEFHAEAITGAASSAEFNKLYPEALEDVMLAACADSGVTLDDIDLIIPHSVNTISWKAVADRFGFPVERIFLDNIPVTGHCFAADPFINYGTAGQLGRLRPGARYLLTAVGLGATYSAMVVEH